MQASYLNELAPRSSRAFSLSLATPFGSAALGCLVILVIGLQGASPGSLPLQQARLAIPLAFSVLGLITMLILRAVTRPLRSAALGEDWEQKRKRIREELRKESELSMPAGDGDDFVRPMGAGDSPLMRPYGPQVIRAGKRVLKPPYLRQDAPAPAPAETAARPPATPPPAPPRARDGRARPKLRIVYSRPEPKDDSLEDAE